MDNLLLSIIFGIVAMFGWGVADYFTAIASRKVGVLKTFFWMRLVSLILASWFLLFTKEKIPLQFNVIFPLFLAGITDFIGTGSFAQGLKIGQLSIVSPIASSWSMITILLSIIFLKEQLSGLQTIAIGLIIIGIWLASCDLKEILVKKNINLFAGVKEALLAMVGWGFSGYFFISVSKSVNAWFLPIMIFRTFSVATAGIYSLSTKKSLSLKDIFKMGISLIIPIAILDKIAVFSYNFGSLIGLASVVTPVATAFGIVTALIGVIFLKEKLKVNQAIGIISVILGIIILSV